MTKMTGSNLTDAIAAVKAANKDFAGMTWESIRGYTIVDILPILQKGGTDAYVQFQILHALLMAQYELDHPEL